MEMNHEMKQRAMEGRYAGTDTEVERKRNYWG